MQTCDRRFRVADAPSLGTFTRSMAAIGTRRLGVRASLRSDEAPAVKKERVRVAKVPPTFARLDPRHAFGPERGRRPAPPPAPPATAQLRAPTRLDRVRGPSPHQRDPTAPTSHAAPPPAAPTVSAGNRIVRLVEDTRFFASNRSGAPGAALAAAQGVEHCGCAVIGCLHAENVLSAPYRLRLLVGPLDRRGTGGWGGWATGSCSADAGDRGCRATGCRAAGGGAAGTMAFRGGAGAGACANAVRARGGCGPPTSRPTRRNPRRAPRPCVRLQCPTPACIPRRKSASATRA